MATGSALLLIDVQNDFCPGGALAVPDGGRVVDALNRHLETAAAKGWPVFASRDWHPPVTRHFSAYGGEWPVHCVAGSHGAAFHPNLHLPASAVIVSKGQDPERPGYSAMEAVSDDGRTLPALLESSGIEHVYVGGLATDYCVRQTVLDALAAGLEVTVLRDAIAGVDVRPGDSARAIAEMERAGASFA